MYVRMFLPHIVLHTTVVRQSGKASNTCADTAQEAIG